MVRAVIELQAGDAAAAEERLRRLYNQIRARNVDRLLAGRCPQRPWALCGGGGAHPNERAGGGRRCDPRDPSPIGTGQDAALHLGRAEEAVAVAREAVEVASQTDVIELNAGALSSLRGSAGRWRRSRGGVSRRRGAEAPSPEGQRGTGSQTENCCGGPPVTGEVTEAWFYDEDPAAVDERLLVLRDCPFPRGRRLQASGRRVAAVRAGRRRSREAPGARRVGRRAKGRSRAPT